MQLKMIKLIKTTYLFSSFFWFFFLFFEKLSGSFGFVLLIIQLIILLLSRRFLLALARIDCAYQSWWSSWDCWIWIWIWIWIWSWCWLGSPSRRSKEFTISLTPPSNWFQSEEFLEFGGVIWGWKSSLPWSPLFPLIGTTTTLRIIWSLTTRLTWNKLYFKRGQPEENFTLRLSKIRSVCADWKSQVQVILSQND